MSKLSDAIKFAVDAHEGQKRRVSNAPYIIHPLEAMVIISQLTKNEDVLCAALLHDVIEDAGVTLEEIRSRFGDRVAQLVSSDTENKRKNLPASETWKVRKEETLKHLAETDDIEEKMIWLADKLSNARAMLVEYVNNGDAIWMHFNQHDKSQHEWYYRSIIDYLRADFANTLAFKELERNVNYIFGGKTE